MLHIAKSFSDIHLPPVDDVFIALGTTIKVSGSALAFLAVDFDAAVTLARAARTAGALGPTAACRVAPRSAAFRFFKRFRSVATVLRG